MTINWIVWYTDSEPEDATATLAVEKGNGEVGGEEEDAATEKEYHGPTAGCTAVSTHHTLPGPAKQSSLCKVSLLQRLTLPVMPYHFVLEKAPLQMMKIILRSTFGS